MKRIGIFIKILLTLVVSFCVIFSGINQEVKKVSAEEENGYSINELLEPIWEGEISYQESVLPVMGESNSLLPIKMLYPIKKIVKVQNASLTITYQENVDYIIHEGELLILRDGNIPIMMHREFYPAVGQSGFEARGGGYVCFSEGDYFHARQIVVTYTHKAVYNGYKPENKAHLLKNIHAKIANKEAINLFVFGDSISVGGNASGFLGVAPYLPTYPELFAEGIRQTYGVEVNIRNASVGGKNSIWGAQTIESALNETEDVDLAIVAFGMNDGNMSGTTFATNIEYIISKIQEKYLDADLLMVATMLPNYDAIKFYGNQEIFHTFLEDLEKESIALVNMTKVHASLLERKKFADMTGNNVNHANDYMSRVYAQTLLEALSGKSEEEEKNSAVQSDSNKITDFLTNCNSSLSVLGCIGILCGVAAIQMYKKEDNES